MTDTHPLSSISGCAFLDIWRYGGSRLRVRDLNKMVAQLRERGITVELDSEVYRNGRFARLSNPEGNPIQLWQGSG
jgi:hypothetical protein